jgi:hypothetical protein
MRKSSVRGMFFSSQIESCANKKTAIAGGFLEIRFGSFIRALTAFPPPWGWNS